MALGAETIDSHSIKFLTEAPDFLIYEKCGELVIFYFLHFSAIAAHAIDARNGGILIEMLASALLKLADETARTKTTHSAVNRCFGNMAISRLHVPAQYVDAETVGNRTYNLKHHIPFGGMAQAFAVKILPEYLSAFFEGVSVFHHGAVWLMFCKFTKFFFIAL